MHNSRSINIDPSRMMNLLPHAVRYKYSMWSELKKLSALINSGHELTWSANEKWCTINGQTFNISKSVYIKRLLESELEEKFVDYFWNEDGRSLNINIAYDFEGSGADAVFDFSIQEVDLKEFDAYLARIFDEK